MNNLNLNSLGVQELNSNEMNKTDGGFFSMIISALELYAIDMVVNYKDHIAAAQRGVEAANKIRI